jgi:hypothetical protein
LDLRLLRLLPEIDGRLHGTEGRSVVGGPDSAEVGATLVEEMVVGHPLLLARRAWGTGCLDHDSLPETD